MGHEDEALDDIAKAIERLDNLVASLPPGQPVGGLREALPEVRRAIKSAYLKLGGVDYWQDHPGGE